MERTLGDMHRTGTTRGGSVRFRISLKNGANFRTGTKSMVASLRTCTKSSVRVGLFFRTDKQERLYWLQSILVYLSKTIPRPFLITYNRVCN